MLNFSNAAKSKLAAAITNTATALSVLTGDGAKFNAHGNFTATIFGAAYTSADQDPNYEIILVNTVSADSFSVITRGQEGRTAQAWNANDNIVHAPTAGALTFDKCRLYQAAAQSIPAGTVTKVTLDTASFDSNGLADLSANRIIPVKAGYYMAVGQVQILSAAGTYLIGYLMKNGATDVQFNAVPGGSGMAATAGVTDLIYFNGSTDYLELWAYSATAQNTEPGSGNVYLALTGPF